MRPQALVTSLWIALFLCASLTGCGNRMDLTAQDGAGGPQQFGGLPALPAGEADSPGIRTVSLASNVQTGAEFEWRSPAGATIEATALELDGNEGFAWGIWKWSGFKIGNVPLRLELTAISGAGDTFYLAFSDYTNGRWEIRGPLNIGQLKNDYLLSTDYISPNENSYVAIVADKGNVYTIQQLNLVAFSDVTPPAVPQNLVGTPDGPSKVDLSWDSVAAADLEGYNVYSGPAPDFDLGDAGVVLINDDPIAATDYEVTGLSGSTTYHFRVTAIDIAVNQSDPSNTATVSTPLDDIPLPPTGLAIDRIGSVSLDIVWDLTAELDIQGYNIYTGTADNFDLGDPGTVKRNGVDPVPGTSYTITGLQKSTQYYVRIAAVDGSSQESGLSNTVNATTLANSPPVPSFTVSPSEVSTDQQVTFNPSATTDEDDDVGDLLFSWDFDNDGTMDEQFTGPSIASFTYDTRGPQTIKLTVEDTDGPVSTTREVIVSFRTEVKLLDAGVGSLIYLNSVDTDPATGRIVVFYEAGTSDRMAYYNGSNWMSIPFEDVVGAERVADVALGDGVIGVLTHGWKVREYNLVGWNEVASGDTDEIFGMGKLAYGPSGRLSVAFIDAPQPPDQQPTQYNMRIWHERADSTLSLVNGFTNVENTAPLDLTRDDTTTYCVYANSLTATQLRLMTVTDSGSSATDQQTVAGNLLQVAMSANPDDSTQVQWGLRTGNGRLYYGDNFGSANGGSQFHAPALAPAGLCGVRFGADNETTLYWVDEDAESEQTLRGFETSGSTAYDIVSGIGIGSNGVSSFFEAGPDEGMYIALRESRDGEVHGYFVDGGTVIEDDVLAAPLEYTGVTQHSHPLVFSNGNVLVLSQQQIPSMLGSFAPSVPDGFTYSQIGIDNWCDLYSATRTGVAGEYFVASLTTQPDVVLTRFNVGDTTGVESEVFPGATQVRLAFNPTGNKTAVFFTDASEQKIMQSNWNGTIWSAPVEVFTTTADIRAFEVSARLNGEWGICVYDALPSMNVIRSTGGTFGPPLNIFNGVLNPAATFGIDFGPDDSFCVAYENSIGDTGMFVTVYPVGGGPEELVELVDGTGNLMRSIMCFFDGASPTVIYHQFYGDPGIHAAEKYGADWETSLLQMDVNGTPIGYSQDASGDIYLSGYVSFLDPATATLGILHQ